MVWRARPGAYKEHGRSRSEWGKAALEERVEGGVPIGILGYLAGQPVAWCSVAPRPTYRPLGGVDEAGEDPERVWSIVCFFVVAGLRHGGLMQRTLAAAIDFARARGATAVEAYPVDADSPSYRFMGFVPAFERAGFSEVSRAGKRRHVFRLALGPESRPGRP